MNLSDKLDLTGKLIIQKINIQHKTIDECEIKNSITLNGRELVAKLFSSETNQQVKPVNYVAVGKGSKEFVATDNQLADEVYRQPIQEIHLQRIDPDSDEPRVKLILTVDLEADNEKVNDVPLTEAGLFSAESDVSGESDVMYNRVQFPPVNKTKDFKLTLIWEIIF